MNIVCVLKNGGDYNESHVYALRDMCLRWMPPHEFICLTDVTGLRCATKALVYNLPGWWSKMELFAAFTFGETLYLDLDTIVRGPTAAMIEAVRNTPFVILRDFYRGSKDPFAMGSGIMFWTGSQRWIFEAFQTAGMPLQLHGDQNFLEQAFQKAGCKAVYWQDMTSDVVSFKVDIQGKPHPAAAPVVAFHGKPRPWEQTQVPYPKCLPVDTSIPCVIVGNGPSVLGSQLGPIIDSFPQVVRINGFTTTNFEEHVGTKTTLHATHGKAGSVSQARELPKRVLWLHEHKPWHAEQSWMVTRAFYWSLVLEWAPDRSILPSAGFVTAAWLLSQGCQRLHLAGFDHFGKKNSQLHHYWRNQPFSQPKEHSPEREQAVFAQWAAEGRVRYL